MKQNNRAGLAILAGGLAFVGTANAVDLIANGSFEAESFPGPTAGTPTGWTGFIRTYNYTQTYYNGPAIPAGENPGTNYSWQHRSVDGVNGPAGVAQATQTVNLTSAVTGAQIDAGMAQFTFSAWLASYGMPNMNPEQPYLTLQFFDAGSAQVGSTVVFDRTSSTLFTVHATGSTTFDGPASHTWAKYVRNSVVPGTARTAQVGVGRSPNASLSGSPDTYVDLVKLDVTLGGATIPPFLSSATPIGSNVSPGVVIQVILTDQTTHVNTNTLQFMFDGATVTPSSLEKVGATTTLLYDPPGLLNPLSLHTYKIRFSDDGVVVTTQTNEFQFTVADWVNLVLPSPKYLETFNSVSEGTGSLPTGWTVANFTVPEAIGFDPRDIDSDYYLDWAVVSNATAVFLSTNYGDYNGLLEVSPSTVVNAAAVPALLEGNSLLAASASRGGSFIQVQYAFSGNYDLSGQANVYLVFNSVWVQNQDSGASVEYSIDGGATWLPALYLLDAPDIILTGSGSIDASNTFATVRGDVADLATMTPGPSGKYGDFIGVAGDQWATLAPYISPRLNDDQAGSKRPEVLRLTQADGQATVRLRFAQHGSDSWYYAIDNVGLYCLDTVPRPLVGAVTPSSQTVAVGSSTAPFVVNASGALPLTYQWRKNGVNIPGANGPALPFPNVQTNDSGSYTVVISNSGGSVTSSVPATLTVLNPAVFVTGQWDFNQGDLRATCGNNLEYFDATVQADTSFGSTTSFGIPDIGGTPANIMRFVPSVPAWGGYKMFHGAAPNGGGTFVNQYTIIYDIFYPITSDATWRSLLQTSTANANDGDVFVAETSNGIGIGGIYEGNVTAETWHRIAIAIDLSGPGPVLTKFIDGVKVGEQTAGLSGVDGRFSLDPFALLFADESGENNQAYVSSVQFSDGRRSDAFLAALGGPSASKIPGCIRIYMQGGNLFVERTGSWGLEGANDVTGPWSEIDGAANPYQVPMPIETHRFYRPKQP